MSKISDADFEKARIADAKRRAMASLASISDAEDAALTAAAESDADNPPAAEFMRRRGRPPLLNPKRAVKLRLDVDVIERFKADGDGWQTRMNEALRKVAGLR
jgi:uncharacterized protein (DUF4415 family)